MQRGHASRPSSTGRGSHAPDRALEAVGRAAKSDKDHWRHLKKLDTTWTKPLVATCPRFQCSFRSWHGMCRSRNRGGHRGCMALASLRTCLRSFRSGCRWQGAVPRRCTRGYCEFKKEGGGEVIVVERPLCRRIKNIFSIVFTVLSSAQTRVELGERSTYLSLVRFAAMGLLHHAPTAPPPPLPAPPRRLDAC